MKVKNQTETVVRAELAKILGGDHPGSRSSIPSFLSGGLNWLRGSKTCDRGGCDCPHCSADILALTLSSLPASYCLSLHYGVGRSRVPVEAVRQKIEVSLRRVRARPRHAARESVPRSAEVRVVDFGIREGTPMVRPLLQRIEGSCCCERCSADTLAYGLNRLQPRYGVEVRGRVRMPPHELDFIRHELLATIHKAAQFVAGNPRHEVREGSQPRTGTV